MSADRLGIGFVGSGFNARFHIQSLTAVREIDVRGVYSPNEKNAASSAALAASHVAKRGNTIDSRKGPIQTKCHWLCDPNTRGSRQWKSRRAIKSARVLFAGSPAEAACRNVAERKRSLISPEASVEARV